MFKRKYTSFLGSALLVLLGGMMAGGVVFSAAGSTATPGTNQIAVVTAVATNDAPELDARRLFALGMIETGNDDRMIGAAGEISRYQLSRVVWKSYSKSRDYENPEISVKVARQHWNYLAAYFKEKTGRTADDFDLYVLWNTRYGYYAHKGFSPRQISPVVKDRARRFVNLINRRG